MLAMGLVGPKGRVAGESTPANTRLLQASRRKNGFANAEHSLPSRCYRRFSGRLCDERDIMGCERGKRDAMSDAVTVKWVVSDGWR